jgi:shikimate dehydrogenase
LLEPDLPGTLREAELVHPGAGLIEFRADHLRPSERVEDGGGFDGSEEERRSSLIAALDAGARYVDVEGDGTLRELAEGEHRDRVILSLHGVDCDLPAIRRAYAGISSSRAALLKIVPAIRHPGEMPAIRRFLEAAGDPRVTCFPVGASGRLARLLALAWGGWGTYGGPPSGRLTAPGQVDTTQMLELHRVETIGAGTRLFLLVGNAVEGSPSPAMHAAAHRASGIDARYLPLEIDEWTEVPGLVEQLGIAGLAVTIPFKEQAASCCVLVDEVARGSRAVNTVTVGSDGWQGYNTDGPAALGLIREQLDPGGVSVAIRGAGGTARALATALRDAGARVMLFNRDRERGERVARELGVDSAELAGWGNGDWDLLVNAAPAAGPPASGWDGHEGGAVLDAVYGPRATPLVESARARGIAAIDGFRLLVEQAVLQFERMNGAAPDPELMRRAGAEWLESRGLLER